MTEQFATQDEAKVRRNELLDASAYAQRPSFAERYTKTSVEEFARYDRQLYAVVDAVSAYPADIEWPPVPVPQTIADFNASLPHVEALP
jgi:hypothetical protein